MSILSDCKQGLIPKEVEAVAAREVVPAAFLRHAVATGRAVVTSAKRGIEPVGIGEGLRKKFGTIVGASSADRNIPPIIRKSHIAAHYGASAIHDGSAAGDAEAIHRALMQELEVPVGFCHSIRVGALCEHEGRNYMNVESEEFISLLEEDATGGCEIMLGPFAITMDLVDRLSHSDRLMPCPNKTGSLMIAWMRHNRRENPYIEHFDRVLTAARENDVVLSFVNGFRSGCIADALDAMQLAEIRQMTELVERAHEAGVQVKAGGGGHVPLDKIPRLFRFEKEQVAAPIISFGPHVTDVSVAYDHITAAIGHSHALMNGADMILTITAAEHLALPTEEEVKESCIIARHVCHSVDLANGKDHEQDLELSKARERLDWKTQIDFSLDPERAHAIRWREGGVMPGCSVCGDSCAYLVIRQSDGGMMEIPKAIHAK